MKFVFDYFNQMTGGLTFGLRILGRNGVIKTNTYHRFIQGFVPQYSSLADESADADFRQKVNPPFALVHGPGVSAVRGHDGTYPTVILGNESTALDQIIYSTDLWHFYSDDPIQTDLGIPNGTPTTNTAIDAVIFNSKIITTHPLDGDIYYGDINATPDWTAIVAGLNDAGHILKVIANFCLVLDSSQGSGKPRDSVWMIKDDLTLNVDDSSDKIGFSITSNDYDIQDIADYQGRYALFFAQKAIGTNTPLSLRETTVFLWDLVPGDSADLVLQLPGVYCCSITKNGVVYVFTQIGTSLSCWAFTGSAFEEIGRIKNVMVDTTSSFVPKTRVAIEGDFFVLLAFSPDNARTPAPFYWIPSNSESFFLLSAIDTTGYRSLYYTLDPATSKSIRYLGYENNGGTIGTLYKSTLEAPAGYDFISDCYDESNKNGFFELPGNSDDASAVAQSFTAKGGLLSKASFYLAKEGSPTGTMVAKLYAHSGTFGTSSVPTGAALATSDTIDISSLTTDFALIEFTFSGSNNIQLTAATNYCIAFEYDTGDASNRPHIGMDSSAPSHNGNAAVFSSSAWAPESGEDLIFAIIEELPQTLSYKSNAIPAPLAKGIDEGGDIGRIQIKRIIVEYNAAPPTDNDSIAFTLTTKDEYESETYTDQSATIKDTTAHSTSANVDAKRAIINLGAYATEFSVSLTTTIASSSWDLVIRRIIVEYEPVASQY